MRFFRPLLIAGVSVLFATGCATSKTRQSAHFSNWPAGTAPAEVGKRVAENFLTRKFEFEAKTNRQYIIYPEICGEYGSLKVAKQAGDTDLQKRLVRRFEPFLTPEGEKRFSRQAHVDYRVAGAVPLE